MDEARRLRRRENLTVALLVAGYSGYYLCRSNLSVCLPAIRAELAAQGSTTQAAQVGLGLVVSVGILAYALGKPIAGPLADFLGGRGNFLAGMAGSVAMTLAFAASGTLPIFALVWVGNRFSQSLGWAGMIKITSRWFGFSRYGGIMAILSLSYLFGDAAARLFMGELLRQGVGWRGVFAIDAAVLLGLFLGNALLLRETPRELGFPEPATNPENLYGAAGENPRPPGIGKLLAPLIRSPAFWLVCMLSLGLTMLREAFNTWTPTYFTEGLGLSTATAAGASALFPFCGGVSVLLAGFLSDRLGRGGRALIILSGLLITGAGLATLGLINFEGSPRWPIVLVAAIAFFLLGPYSYLAGAISLDLGGKQGGATTSGFVDLAGYLGGVLAGWGLARASIAFGWRGVFVILAGVAWVSAAVALIYLIEQRRAKGIEPDLTGPET